MPKVAVVGTRNMPADYGGVETACENLYVNMVERGMKVIAFCRSESFKIEHTEYKGVKVVNFPVPNIAGVGTFIHCFIASILASFTDADIIHFHAQGPALFTFIPRIISPKKKIGFTCQGRDWQRDKWKGFAKAVIKKGEKHSALFTDFRIMVSNDLKNYYESTYGVDSVRIPNGVDQSSRLVSSDFIQRFGLEKDNYLLFIGRLVPEKAPDILIKAFNGITTNIKLVIAGDSPETPEYVRHLKELASNNPNIIFTSYIRGNDITEAYSNALAYVSPSKLEGNPITALEAMSYSLPLLISDIPPHEEILSFFKEAPIASFKVNSIEDCRKRLLETIVMSKQRLKEIGRESLDVVKEHFSWQNIADKTLKVYMDSLNQRQIVDIMTHLPLEKSAGSAS